MKSKIQGSIFHHSIIQLSNGHIKKYLEPNYNFLPMEQENLVKNIIEFRKLLFSAGIPIAKEYEVFIENGVIVEETVNCGVDGYKIIKSDSNLKREMILRKIVKALCPVLVQSEVVLVPDPHPANWCFDDQGLAHYIDFQPPRFKLSNGQKLVGFPQPVGKEYDWSVGRYYSKAGLVRILRFNSMRAGGLEMHNLLLSIMQKEWPTHLVKEVISELESLPEGRVRRNELSLCEALECCDLWSIDDIRELAMIVAEKMKVGANNFLNDVLEATRADFNIPLDVRKQAVEKAKMLIKNTSEEF